MGTKQSLIILLGYLSCDDPVIKTKYSNILASYYHKDEGIIIKTVEGDGSGGTNITFSDDTTLNLPVLPDSKPIAFITGLVDALNTKVDKVIGKQLSTEDFTTEFKNKLSGLANYVHPDEHSISEVQGLQDILTELQNSKVDKVDGFGLSQNNLTDELVIKINAANTLNGSRIIRGSYAILPDRKIRLAIYEYIIADEYFDIPIITELQMEVGGAEDRIDATVINSLSAAVIKKGLEDVNTPFPPIDIATELLVTWRIMRAGASEPEGVTSSNVYNENLGQAGGEWDGSTNAPTRINFGGSLNPTSGLKSVTATVINQYDTMSFFKTDGYAVDPDGSLQFKVNLQTAWGKNDKVWVLLYDQAGRIHTNFPTLKSGAYGLDGSELNAPQIIAIPLQEYAITRNSFTQIQFFFLTAGKTFSIDEIQLFDGTNQPPSGGGTGQVISRTSQIPINDGQNGTNPYLTTLELVNDLITGGVGKVLTAEQGKVLKVQIDAINMLLTSDNVNLDTVQEIVDAIEAFQTSLDTILVNDLTTGGTTKALTAEMGKTLKGLIDTLTLAVNLNTAKVSFPEAPIDGKTYARKDGAYIEVASKLGIVDVAATAYTFLITDVTKKVVFSAATAVTATIPTNAVTAIPIASRIEVTQSGNGVVTLVTTGLTVISASPLFLVKGQTVALIKTAINTWSIEGNNFSGNLAFPSYLSTRDDGVNPTNKVLSTDTLGNVKLYKQGVFPAPYIDIVVPDSTLPSTTGNFELYGSFFTPTMTVVFTGQTVHYFTFHTTNWITVNVTTGATEGLFSITLDNGLSKTFANAYMVVLGTVIKPLTADWSSVSQMDVSEGDSVNILTYNSVGLATWNKPFNYLIDWELQFDWQPSPLGIPINEAMYSLSLKRTSDNVAVAISRFGFEGATYKHLLHDGGSLWQNNYNKNATDFFATKFRYRYIASTATLYIYANSLLFHTFVNVAVTSNLYMVVSSKSIDHKNIKYIELAT